jgi:spermidine synthase
LPKSGLESRHDPRLLYLLSFVSGAAALAYQVCWSRMLALTFGSTVLAASAVVAGFMGGMGIGAWLYRRVERPGLRPLRVYGWIEVGIGVSALLLTLAFQALPEAFAAAASWLPGSLPRAGVQYTLVFTMLLPSAALMGATFPALSRAVIGTPRDVDRHLGTIYGLNTLGAAAGALLAGFFLLERLGLFATAASGVVANLAVAAVALTVGGAHDRAAGVPAEGREPAETSVSTSLPFGVSGIVLFGSGFTTLGYEILWFRALRYLFGNSTYALTMMLVIFLVGLGVGGLLLRAVVARRSPERDLGICQFAIGVSALSVITVLASLIGTDFFQKHLSVFSAEFLSRPWGERVAVTAGLAFIVTVPATIPMGLSFPLASRLFLSDVRRLGTRLGGAVFLANLGSILGSLVAAIWMLPELGTLAGTCVLATLNLVLGVVVLASLPAPVRGRFTPAGIALAATLALLAVLPGRIDFRGARVGPAAWRLVFAEEGDLATVQVHEDPTRPGVRTMSIDGTIIGVSAGGPYQIYNKQILLAHLPLELDPRIRRVLNIGLGSASTLEALAAHPDLERIDTVEINEGVVRGSRVFADAVALEDRRSRVFVDDALHFLRSGSEPYDLIVSDGKQNLDFSGNAKLLSLEFYEAANRRLTPDGILVQWIPLDVLGSDFEIIVRTVANVFPEVEVFFDLPSSVLIVASREPLAGRPRSPEPRFANLRVAADLSKLGIKTPSDLFSRWVADRRALLEVAGDGELNRWDRMPLEFSAYRSTLAGMASAAAGNLERLEAAQDLAARRTTDRLLPEDSPDLAASRLLREALLRNLSGDPDGAVRAAKRALEIDPKDPSVATALENLRRSSGASQAPRSEARP